MSRRDAHERIARWPYENLGWARLDTHRRRRRGYPEVVLAEGKTAEQLIRIIRRFASRREALLLTRLSPQLFQAIHTACPALRYHPLARVACAAPRRRDPLEGMVAVVTAGTSDVPVAEEAAVTLEWLGSRPARLYDVGVAGIHRLLSQLPLLRRARAIIVVAGMEGALASVVAGVVHCPVVAVPTSVGYGAAFQGVAPLLAMLNSCVPGVGVVNIDNGFGAACLAHMINRTSR
ncbi:MAG: nickel pincer cofactor biosynthesis protein LarB [Candidatus Omnitrophica bacterium]|nr:nickel pincer cofactor biosynthesis protein LarB [Candidatus Omnitrophota bacterium]